MAGTAVTCKLVERGPTKATQVTLSRPQVLARYWLKISVPCGMWASPLGSSQHGSWLSRVRARESERREEREERERERERREGASLRKKTTASQSICNLVSEVTSYHF